MQKSVIYFKRTLPEKVIQLLVSISMMLLTIVRGRL